MYRDAANNIQDVWYDGHGWNLQQLTGTSADLGNEPIVNNNGVMSSGPLAASDPFVSVFGNQQHAMYRDSKNNIQDVWYDGNKGSWNLQQLTGGPTGDFNNEPVVNNAGPPPAGAIFVSVYNNQQHVTYRDKDSNVQDVWYNQNGGWNLQQLSQPPLTINNEFLVNNPGPNSAGNIFTSVYYDQQHFTYRDTNNNIQDLWYNGAGWHLQQLAGD
jgi:hypothetical protein